MKKILLFITILLIAGSLQAQKFTGVMVMPGSTTAFGLKLPVGTPIFQKASGTWYITDSITLSTKTITTALSASHIHAITTGGVSLADTGANKKFAAYYTTVAALALKAAKSDTGANKKNAAYYDMTTKLVLKAPKASPTFTGNVKIKSISKKAAPAGYPVYWNTTDSTLRAASQDITYDTVVSITAEQVATMGVTPVVLIGQPGSGKFIHILSCVYYMNVATKLEVGTQLLTIMNTGNLLVSMTNATVESAAGEYWYTLTPVTEKALSNNSAVFIKFYSGNNPDSGSASYKIFLRYKIISL